MDIRLSYNDVQLFLAIAKSIPQQTSAAMPESSASVGESTTNPTSSLVAEPSCLTSENREIPKRVLDPVLGRFLTPVTAATYCSVLVIWCFGTHFFFFFKPALNLMLFLQLKWGKTHFSFRCILF